MQERCQTKKCQANIIIKLKLDLSNAKKGKK
jgi:hypothetical protein